MSCQDLIDAQFRLAQQNPCYDILHDFIRSKVEAKRGQELFRSAAAHVRLMTRIIRQGTMDLPLHPLPDNFKEASKSFHSGIEKALESVPIDMRDQPDSKLDRPQLLALGKDPKERTTIDIDLLGVLLHSYSYFKQMAEVLRTRLRKYVCYQRFQFGDIVYSEGDDAATVYTIISGSVAALVDIGTPQPKFLWVFGPGDTFGEWAVTNHGRRPGTILATEALEVLVIHRADYIRIWKDTVQKSEMELHAFVAGCSLFRDLPAGLVSKLTNRGQQLSFTRGDVVQRQGELATALYIILEGECNVFKSVSVDKKLPSALNERGRERHISSTVMTPVTIVGAGEHFGEACLYTRPGRPGASTPVLNHTATLVAASSTLRLLQLKASVLQHLVLESALYGQTIRRIIMKNAEELSAPWRREEKPKPVTPPQTIEDLLNGVGKPKKQTKFVPEKLRTRHAFTMANRASLAILFHDNCDCHTCLELSKKRPSDHRRTYKEKLFQRNPLEPEPESVSPIPSRPLLVPQTPLSSLMATKRVRVRTGVKKSLSRMPSRKGSPNAASRLQTPFTVPEDSEILDADDAGDKDLPPSVAGIDLDIDLPPPEDAVPPPPPEAPSRSRTRGSSGRRTGRSHSSMMTSERSPSSPTRSVSEMAWADVLLHQNASENLDFRLPSLAPSALLKEEYKRYHVSSKKDTRVARIEGLPWWTKQHEVVSMLKSAAAEVLAVHVVTNRKRACTGRAFAILSSESDLRRAFQYFANLEDRRVEIFRSTHMELDMLAKTQKAHSGSAVPSFDTFCSLTLPRVSPMGTENRRSLPSPGMFGRTFPVTGTKLIRLYTRESQK